MRSIRNFFRPLIVLLLFSALILNIVEGDDCNLEECASICTSAAKHKYNQNKIITGPICQKGYCGCKWVLRCNTASCAIQCKQTKQQCNKDDSCACP